MSNTTPHYLFLTTSTRESGHLGNTEWLAHRLHRIEGKGFILHWHSLREQFAQEYTGKDADKDFKKKFLPALQKVLAVYPQAKVQQVRGGILLNGSPPPIPYKGGPTK